MENLQQAAFKLGEEIYKTAGPAGGAPGAGPGGPAPEAQGDRGTTEAAGAGGKKDDDVIDAEYEVKE
jgi:hypothetical protein